MFPFKLVTREEEQVGLPSLFSETEKKCSNFGKKCSDCSHLCVKFLI